MPRKLIGLFFLVIVALIPFGNTSAETAQQVSVVSSGQMEQNLYFYGSRACDTSDDYVTYMYRGGPVFSARGISPASGNVYEYFDAVGSSAWGKAYFFNESTNDAFDFYFEGTLECTSRTSGVVRGNWPFGYAYSVDRATGQELCTRLDGSGTVEIRFDLRRQSTSTTITGAYTRGATEVCQ